LLDIQSLLFCICLKLAPRCCFSDWWLGVVATRFI